MALSLCAASLAASLAACSILDLAGDRDRLLDQSAGEGWTLAVVDSRPFALFTARRAATAEILTVYVEGDGRSWQDPYTPSDDPTPRRPVALRLALADQSPNVLYVARPCQYRGLARSAGCDVKYWTTHRLAPEVIASLSSAIDQAKATSHSRAIELIGYSGGGAAAALLAERRADVVGLVTVAGNLDLAAWAKMVNVRPLDGSLDPADAAHAAAHIPQYHWVGTADDIVPIAATRGFAVKEGLDPDAVIGRVAGHTHDCCWHEDWTRRIAKSREMLRSMNPGVPAIN